jgi:hypothetical protein
LRGPSPFGILESKPRPAQLRGEARGSRRACARLDGGERRADAFARAACKANYRYLPFSATYRLCKCCTLHFKKVVIILTIAPTDYLAD